MSESRAALEITAGDDFHLTLLMVPMSLNFVTGRDRESLLEYARAVWQASRKQALEDSVCAIEDANARRVVYTPDCVEIIKGLI